MTDRVKENRRRDLAELTRAGNLARATGGCEMCFKPHDPAAPSCNQQECCMRWERHSGRAAASMASSDAKGQP